MLLPFRFVSIRCLVSILVLCLFLFETNAQNNKTAGNIIFKGKIYTVGSSELDLIYAKDASISIVLIGRGVDTKSNNFDKKYGVFKEELLVNERYEILISKKGYEAKSFEFSTEGANPNSKYVFAADIVLKEEGKADDYSEESHITHIVYDKSKNGFVMID